MNCITRWCVVAAMALGLMLPTSSPLAAGIQALKVPADGPLPVLSGAVWYPCAAPPTAMQVGPFSIFAVKDCPIAGKNLPLIVMSHGRTGSFLGHRDTAQVLADAGFVVVAVSHPGDNAQDASHSNDLSAFVDRPAEIKRLVDYLLDSWGQRGVIDATRIGFFGFSRGGYTGLVVVGAEPRFDAAIGLCAGQTSAICDQVRRGGVPPPVHDRRFKAAVIADPLSIFFTKGSFNEVRVPIQLWRSERGGDGVTPTSVDAIAGELPSPPEFRAVPNSQHFSFLPPCPQDLARGAPELCIDPPGFERDAFHNEFNAAVLAFFRKTLH